MSLRDPVAVYTAASNVDAQLVRNALIKSGVEAFVTEDVSQVGPWILGLIAQVPNPQVWVEKANVERARPILEEYEHRAKELQDPEAGGPIGPGRPVEVVCAACGEVSMFPAVQRGSVQQCQFCKAYVDVDNDDVADVILEPNEEGETEVEPES
jgi:hypothetical protein